MSDVQQPRRDTSDISDSDLEALECWWRAANYLSVGQIYLMRNPLLREELAPEHVKPRLLGHWGTTPGLNFVHAHLNRMVLRRDLDMMYVMGPGHGGPGPVAAAWLDGTYSEVYPDVSRDEPGMQRLFKQFSFPGGIPSHVAPETPGSIHEGGELGYAVSHAFGAAFDNPDLVVAAVVGDGEAETGALAASWHSTKFLNPARDGAVLPVLHLNGYKIANPTVLARVPRDELTSLMTGYGWEPVEVDVDPAPGPDGEDVDVPHEEAHRRFAAALEHCLDRIAEIQRRAREDGDLTRPRWPMIVLRSPKGWTGPKETDGRKIEGSWRSHQVPFADTRTNESHRGVLAEWLRSYRPEELFDADGVPVETVSRLSPAGRKRLSDTPHANGGELRRPLRLPAFADYAIHVPEPARVTGSATQTLGTWLRDVMRANEDAANFRVFAPDENNSNRLQDLLDATSRTWLAETISEDVGLSPDGRVMEILSETTIQGWLEGYLLTGRHGVFSCYEAFIHIVTSMFNQHAKWLKVSTDLPWRRPIASLNYLLTSHVWRQDHNGFSHQDPGFIDHVVNKKADVIRVYLPPDANTLLSTMDHCLRSTDYVNVVVAGKQPSPQYLDIDAAVRHCTKGIGIWSWASTDADAEPDVVMACAGDVPTHEALAAVDILLGYFPDLRIRFVNVVDLMRLQSASEHPHGLSEVEFDSLFTKDRPVIFNYHGYPWLIHRLTYKRANHDNIHARGYIEEGTTTTPFDMCVLNSIDRFHLAIDVIDRVPRLGARAAHAREELADLLIEHKRYTRENGEDMPSVADWVWRR